VIALKNKPRAIKCNDRGSRPHGTYSKDSEDSKKKD